MKKKIIPCFALILFILGLLFLFITDQKANQSNLPVNNFDSKPVIINQDQYLEIVENIFLTSSKYSIYELKLAIHKSNELDISSLFKINETTQEYIRENQYDKHPRPNEFYVVSTHQKKDGSKKIKIRNEQIIENDNLEYSEITRLADIKSKIVEQINKHNFVYTTQDNSLTASIDNESFIILKHAQNTLESAYLKSIDINSPSFTYYFVGYNSSYSK